MRSLNTALLTNRPCECSLRFKTALNCSSRCHIAWENWNFTVAHCEGNSCLSSTHNTMRCGPRLGYNNHPVKILSTQMGWGWMGLKIYGYMSVLCYRPWIDVVMFSCVIFTSSPHRGHHAKIFRWTIHPPIYLLSSSYPFTFHSSPFRPMASPSPPSD